MSPPLAAHLDWFATLSPASLEHIDQIYSADCHFRDPFNSVHGRERVRLVYAHMFATTTSPRFVIERVLEHDGHAAVFWRFLCGVRGRAIDIGGMSELWLDDDGLIREHIDYWDSAELYARLPVVGAAVRWLKRQAKLPG